MAPTNENPSPKNQEAFLFQAPSYAAWFSWAALVFFGLSFLTISLDALSHKNLAPLVGLILPFMIVAICWRRIARPLPSRAELVGGSLVFYDLPSFWLDVNGFQIPLLITSEVKILRTTVAFEWISGVLVWNDMERGRSITLARGPQAKAFEIWLRTNGLSVPVGES